MAYIQVEASVRTHRKFLKAGPAASWLWLCGVGYCQDGLTDGFIPFEAIDFLGIKGSAARKFKATLISVGLWEEVPGGWRVHDYLRHNKSASSVADIKARRGAGGKLGGRPAEPSTETFKVTQEETLPETFTEMSRDEPSRDEVSVLERGPGKTAAGPCDFPLDRWFRDLVAAYPEQSRTDGHLTEVAWFDIFRKDLRPAGEIWAEMHANLENQKRGHQWLVKRMIPRLDNWLKTGAWKQRHDEQASAAEQLSPKTSRTLQAAASILREPA